MKRVIITGGARGIGWHLAIAYRKKGYEVFVLDKANVYFEDAYIHTFNLDLCNADAVADCFHFIKEMYGDVHVLINNGAISKFHKSIYDITIEEFDRMIHTNLRGTFACCKAFVQHYNPNNYGRIINIASTRYHQNEADWEAYGASKGGIVSLTNSLCVSLSHTNITVNAISPGWIATENDASLSMMDHLQHPSRRVGTPQDIANLCLFLSEEENDFINGANMIVDGGMTKKMMYVDEEA